MPRNWINTAIKLTEGWYRQQQTRHATDRLVLVLLYLLAYWRRNALLPFGESVADLPAASFGKQPEPEEEHNGVQPR